MNRNRMTSTDRRLRLVRNDENPQPFDRFVPTATGLGYIAGRNGMAIEDHSAFDAVDLANFETGHRLAIDEKSGCGGRAIVRLLCFFAIGFLAVLIVAL